MFSNFRLGVFFLLLTEIFSFQAYAYQVNEETGEVIINPFAEFQVKAYDGKNDGQKKPEPKPLDTPELATMIRQTDDEMIATMIIQDLDETTLTAVVEGGRILHVMAAKKDRRQKGIDKKVALPYSAKENSVTTDYKSHVLTIKISKAP